MSCTAGQSGKFARLLEPGPSLLSVPLVLSNESIEHVLRFVEFDKAWAYDAPSGLWTSYEKNKPYLGNLRAVNREIGIWVNVTANSSFTIAGIVPAQTTITLLTGWNLVGFPHLGTSLTVAELKATVPVERVEALDVAAPPNFLRLLLDTDVLLAGQAYWVKVSQDAAWVVTN
jgi:hypothetical protein